MGLEAGAMFVWMEVHHGLNYYDRRSRIVVRQETGGQLAGELEAIAIAAADRLRAVSDGDAERETELRRRVGEAASRAIGAGLSLASIADAERLGHRRAREELGRELLRRVERAAGRRRAAEHEYEQSVLRACRVGLAHRDVAAAAQVAHGTVRAIAARTNTVSAEHEASTTTSVGAEPGQ
jgi:hypothetical protein